MLVKPDTVHTLCKPPTLALRGCLMDPALGLSPSLLNVLSRDVAWKRKSEISKIIPAANSAVVKSLMAFRAHPEKQ